jgi:peptidoglycan hydrolase-like protein with peptidoglycan-binding domain
MLQVGSKGDQVIDLQEKLNAANAGVAGYIPLVTDGIYGAKTQAAVTAYQKANNLTVDGIAGPQTFGALNTVKPTSTQPVAPTGTRIPEVPAFTPPPIPEYTQNPDIQGALDDYNKWASKPYKSEYASEIEDLVKDILSRQFEYDPADDGQFQVAAKELTRNVMEAMNARGILNSTVTENQVQRGIANMLPQYQELARNRFMEEGQLLMSQVDMLMGIDETGYNRYKDEGEKYLQALDIINQMDETQYNRWKDAYETRYQQYKDSYDASLTMIEGQRAKVQDAWNRVSELGYVDNQSSIILGVPAGTLSKEAREAKIKREQDLADQKTEYNRQLSLINAQYEKERKLAAAREGTTTDVTKLGTPEQLKYYNELLSIYMGGGEKYANNPYEAYKWLIGQGKQQNVSLVGDKLYQQLLTDVQNAMKMQKSYGSNFTPAQQLSQQQTDVDNTALAEATAQQQSGSFVAWFDSYKDGLAQDLSTTAYNKLLTMYNAEIKAQQEAEFRKELGAD